MKEIIDFETISGDKSVVGVELYGETGSPRITIERLAGRAVEPEVLLGVLCRYDLYVQFVKANYKNLCQHKDNYVLESKGSGGYSLWHYIIFESKYNEGIPRLVGEYQDCGIVFEGSMALLTHMFLNYSSDCVQILESVAGDTNYPGSYEVGDKDLLKPVGYPTKILKARLHTKTGDMRWFRGIRNIAEPFKEYWEY